MSNSGTFKGVATLQAWAASGGVARAGLPLDAMVTLLTSVSVFANAVRMLEQSLLNVEAAWSKISGDNMLKASLGRLIGLLGDASLDAKAASQRAVEVKLAANKIFGTIDREITRHSKEIERLTAAIAHSEAQIEQAQKDIQAARDKLNPGDWFLHGLEAIFTLGTTDRNLDNLKKLEDGKATFIQEMVSQDQNRSLLEQYKSELTALRNGVARVLDVDQTMTAFQNDLLAVAPAMREAYAQFEKSETAKTVKLANIRLRKAQPQMDALLAWIDTFRLK